VNYQLRNSTLPVELERDHIVRVLAEKLQLAFRERFHGSFIVLQYREMILLARDHESEAGLKLVSAGHPLQELRIERDLVVHRQRRPRRQLIVRREPLPLDRRIRVSDQPLQQPLINFLPGQLLPAPQNASTYESVEFLEQNVWPTEATLLKAAIAGVKMADPNAKIALHIEGLGVTPADIFVRAFFTTMVNLGAPFDVAGLSHPYMESGWFPGPITQYTFACWAQRMDSIFRDIAALGKKGMIAEGGYENSTVNISLNDPMPGFPVTPQGQAA
jgi:hypothetical protein